MSRRTAPRLAPTDLREHADEARVTRVWDRIEHDLTGLEVAPVRSTGLVYFAIAAAFAAFGGGLLTGKVTWSHRPSPEAIAPAPIEKTDIGVLAAGTEVRSYPLPGGGRITLSPRSTVEVERPSADALTLQLVQGEASVIAGSAGRPAIAIVAGDVRLDAQAASVVNVRRNQDDMNVSVAEGSVSILSPAGGTQRLGSGESRDVPIHGAITTGPVAAGPRTLAALPPRRTAGPSGPKVAGGPDWLVRHNQNDDDGALALLKKRDVNATIEAARSPGELAAIGDIMRSRGNDTEAAIRAYKRIIERFPGGGEAYAAAMQIASMYANLGRSAEAQEYRTRADKLVPVNGRAADAILCNSIKDQVRRLADKTTAAGLAKEYLDKYPDGQCKEDFERMLQPDGPAPAPGPAPVDAALAPAPAP